MAIQFLDEGSDQLPGELLWLKDYIKAGGDYATPTSVLQVSIGLRGALVLTAKWKGFIFNGSVTYAHLTEALTQYVSTTEPLPWLVACGTESGKVRVAIDTDLTIGYWTKEGDSYYQKSNTGDGEDTRAVPVNPLLPSTIPPNGTRARTTSSRTAPKTKSS